MGRIYYFTVGGFSMFPFKLLCADKAWPATEADAEAIEYAAPTEHRFVRVRLASTQEPSAQRWREARWPVDRVE